MNVPVQAAAPRRSALDSVVLVTGCVSLLIVLVAFAASSWLTWWAATDPNPAGCMGYMRRGAGWGGYPYLAMLAGGAIAVVTLIYGRDTAGRRRAPAFVAGILTLPLIFAASLQAFATFGFEC